MENVYLQEAFKALDILNEEDFNLASMDGLKDAKEFIDKDEESDFIDIIDPEATTEDELKDSYIGDVILDCTVCHSKLYKNPEEIQVDEAEGLANVDEECPFCYSTDGFEIIGMVAPYGEKIEEEEPEEEVEVEETEDEIIEEGIFNKKKKQQSTSQPSEDKKSVDPKKMLKMHSTDTFKGYFLNGNNKALGEYHNKDEMLELGQSLISRGYVPSDGAAIAYFGESLKEGIGGALLGGAGGALLGGAALGPLGAIGGAALGGLTGNALTTDTQESLEESVDISEYQKWVDYDMKKYGRISFATMKKIKKAGFSVVKDQYGDYEVIADRADECLKEAADKQETYSFDDAVDYIESRGIRMRPHGGGFMGNYVLKLLDPDDTAWKDNNISYSKETLDNIIDKLRKDNEQKHIDYINDVPNKAQLKSVIRILFSQDRDLYAQMIKVPTDMPFKKYKEAIIDVLHNFTLSPDSYSTDYSSSSFEDEEKATYSYDDAFKYIESKGISADPNDLVGDYVCNLLDRYARSDDTYSVKTLDSIIRKAKKWIKDNPEFFEESLKEHFEKVEIETEDQKMEMTAEDDGKVTVVTEPKEEGEEVVAPVSDEIQSEINPIDDSDDGFEDIEISEFSEDEFNELGESYLKNIYENVNSFRTSSIMSADNKLVVEGIIGFNSGKQKKTSFVFESKDISKKGKVRFIGENLQMSRGKKAFTITGTVNEGKFIAESLNYNYRAKDSDGKSTRLYGTVRTNK